MSVLETERIVYPSDTPTTARPTPPILSRLISVVAVLAVLGMIAAGVYIASHTTNDGVAILAAVLCAGVIAAVLAPARAEDTTTDKIYYIRIGNRIVRMYGDTDFDKWHRGQK